MLKNLKLGAASLLVLSLLLPMSSCTRSQISAEVAAQHTEIVQVQRYIVSSQSSWFDWLCVLNFFTPLFLSLFALQRSPGLTQLLLQIIAPVPALIVVWAHAITGDLALGGYTALLCCLVYFCLAVTELMTRAIKRVGFKPASIGH